MKKDNNKKVHRLFSKALFKQSCKANGIMWIIITVSVCFMLACVMLISGTSNISEVKDGVQDTIIEELIKSNIKKTSVNLYDNTNNGEYVFDTAFVDEFNKLNTKENYDKYKAIELKATADATTLVTNKVSEKVSAEVSKEIREEIEKRVSDEKDTITAEVSAAVAQDMTTTEAQNKVATYVANGDTLADATSKVTAEYLAVEKERIVNEHVLKATNEINTTSHQQEVANKVLMANQETYVKEAKLELANELSEIELNAYNDSKAKFVELYIKPAYSAAANKITNSYDNNSSEYGSIMVTINPNNVLDSKYSENNESIPGEYIEELTNYMLIDVNSWSESTTPSTYLSDYINTDERASFRNNRAYNSVSMIIAAKMNEESYKQSILDLLSNYNVTEEKYDQMDFNYNKVKKISHESMLEYQQIYDYEVSCISSDIKNNKESYDAEKQRIHDELYLSVAGSLLDKLPQNVSDGIEELGTMDLYGLIVGSIFFKMAGLLLPIIYVIMASNNLIASQVDTGSMAYVLSTSTRREEVTFTQALYLILSLALMFVCTSITACICLKIANITTNLTYGKLLLINLGAFITLFAISGINFLTSCYFDRSKKAMALGGGISMFFLVATMLGLFGSPVIPSVVRISALNNFNYVSLISLFDVVSILDNGSEWAYKLVILLLVGLVGYIIGSLKFKKKDLPL